MTAELLGYRHRLVISVSWLCYGRMPTWCFLSEGMERRTAWLILPWPSPSAALYYLDTEGDSVLPKTTAILHLGFPAPVDGRKGAERTKGSSHVTFHSEVSVPSMFISSQKKKKEEMTSFIKTTTFCTCCTLFKRKD